MATVIDSLVILLNLDPTQFTKGQKEAMDSLKKTDEAAEKHTKNIEAKAKMAAGGFKAMRNELLGLVTGFASVAGATAFVAKITESDAAVGRMAANLGIGVNRLAAWQKMSASFGGSSEDMSAAFRNINRIVQDFSTKGTSDAVTPLTKLLGAEGFADFISKTATVEDRMKLVQKSIAAAPNRQNALTWAQEAGFTETTFTVMSEIGGKLDETINKFAALNAVTRQNSEDSKAMLATWNELTQSAEALGRSLMYTVAPALNKAMKGAGSFLGYISNGNADSSFGTDIHDALQGNNQLGDYKGRGSSSTPSLFGWLSTKSGRSRSPGPLPTAPRAPASQASASAPRVANDWRDAAQVARDSESLRIIQDELSRETDPAARASLQRELTRMASGAGVGNINSFARSVARGPVAYAKSVTAGAASPQRAQSGAAPSLNVGGVTINATTNDGAKLGRDFVSGAMDKYSLVTQAGQGLR